MKIVVATPPLFDEIDAAFGVAGKPVLFAWGDTIYNPMGRDVHPSLLAHETVHGRRQCGGVPIRHDANEAIEIWWRRYIAEPKFRLDEELPAHRAEFRWYASQPGFKRPVNGFRSYRELALATLAKRLSGPLYGNMISFGAARQALAA